jgi:predicted RNA-binding Zn-ribbon protein involved in translation (DUF1610 family)
MATLVFQDASGQTRSVELRAGLNRIGRGAYSDLFIDHASVSAAHCEVVVEPDGMMVRDLGSTNGTCIDGQRVRYSPIRIGQTLTVGHVQVSLVETELKVVIPEFRDQAVPPVLKTSTGQNVCIHHDARAAIWKCTRCGHLLCMPCIRQLRRRGGVTRYFCPDCSGPCEVLPEYQKKEKATWLGAIKQKLKLPAILGRKKKATEPES